MKYVWQAVLEASVMSLDRGTRLTCSACCARANPIRVIDRPSWVYAASYKWTKIEPAAGSVIPPSRTAHAATRYHRSMIVFGGWNGERELDDVFSFDTGKYCNGVDECGFAHSSVVP